MFPLCLRWSLRWLPAKLSLRRWRIACSKRQSAGEAIAVVRASCERCDWAVEGREAAALRLSFDGKYSQHVLLDRGSGNCGVPGHPGSRHRGDASHVRAPGPGAVVGEGSRQGDGRQASAPTSSPRVRRHLAQAMAPSSTRAQHRREVHRRPGVHVVQNRARAAGAAVPLLRDLQQRRRRDDDRSADGDLGPHHRHRVRLRRHVDRDGKVVAEEFQGQGHEVPPFRGRHEGMHPLQWVSTDNNMVSESGRPRSDTRRCR